MESDRRLTRVGVKRGLVAVALFKARARNGPADHAYEGMSPRLRERGRKWKAAKNTYQDRQVSF